MKTAPFHFKYFNIDLQLGSHKGLHNHLTYKGSIPGIEAKWYAKKVQSLKAATREQLANELFRLIKPDNQPRTLVAEDQQDNQTIFYVLSEHLSSSSFHFMPLKEKFLHPDVQGLGEILVISIWLNEIDLKHANFIKDTRSHQIGKIDNGECFYSLKIHHLGKKQKALGKHVSFKPTLELINQLPHPQGYSSYNWLHYVEENKDYTPYQACDTLNDTRSPTLIQGIHRALLRIILTPSTFIRAMIEAYLCSDEYDVFFSFLNEQHTQIKTAALSSELFQNYLRSDDAKITATQHVKHMSNLTILHVTNLTESKLKKSSSSIDISRKSPVTEGESGKYRCDFTPQRLQLNTDTYVMKDIHQCLELQSIFKALDLPFISESPVSVNRLSISITPGLTLPSQSFFRSLWRGCMTNASDAIVSPSTTPTNRPLSTTLNGSAF